MGAHFTLPEAATIDDVRREMEALLAGTPQSTAPETNDASALAADLGCESTALDAIRRDLDALLARYGEAPCLVASDAPLGGRRGHVPTTHDAGATDGCPTSTVCPAAGQTTFAPAEGVALLRREAKLLTVGNFPAEPPTVAAARALYLRRQLAAAVEGGVDLLAALGLPRLVGPDHIVVDPGAAGDAIEAAVAVLDALDADGADLESEAGYDLPEGDDELDDDGLSRGEFDDSASEPSLGSPTGDGDQRRWAQGDSSDREQAHELPAARPIGPAQSAPQGYEHDRDMRALARQAEALKRRLHPEAGPRRADREVVFLKGLPCITRHGVPVVGWTTA